MKRCAVIIGVNTTGSLPTLTAAVDGAHKFADWAQNQGFEIKIHVDTHGAVTINDIKRSVKHFVDQKIYSQMIIFFAGHGILKSAGNEQWLLTEAPDDVNAAVNVQTSRFLSRNTGIPHIIFISDACRSNPTSTLLSEVTGSVIFPNLYVPQTSTDVDMFYATLPGNPAYEVKADIAVPSYRAIYTDCLLRGLSGEEPSMITSITENNTTISTVQSYELKKYLEVAVSQAAQTHNIGLNQNPDSEVTSRSPKYLSKVAAPNKIKPIAEQKMPEIDELIKFNRREPFNEPTIHVQLTKTISEIRNDRKNELFNDSVKKLINARGREKFETMTGFTIVGTNQVTPVVTNEQFEMVNDEDGSLHIRIPLESKGLLMLLVLENGLSVPLAILQGFIGTVVIENNVLINVNYMPSANSPKYHYAEKYNEQIEARRARVATVARFEGFKLPGDKYQVIEQASYLRNRKAFDPTLGLYAAYAYAQAGDNDGIRSVYEYMEREPEAVLFDVWMLAKITKKVGDHDLDQVSPFCPLLTQGWSFLEIDYDIFSPKLRRLAKYLVPGLWTTFNEKGTEIVRNIITNRTNI